MKTEEDTREVIASAERRGAGGTIEHNDPLIRFRASFPFEIFLDDDYYDYSLTSKSTAMRNKAGGLRRWTRSKRREVMEWLGLLVRNNGNGLRAKRASGVGVGFDLCRTERGWEIPQK